MLVYRCRSLSASSQSQSEFQTLKKRKLTSAVDALKSFKLPDHLQKLIDATNEEIAKQKAKYELALRTYRINAYLPEYFGNFGICKYNTLNRNLCRNIVPCRLRTIGYY